MTLPWLLAGEALKRGDWRDFDSLSDSGSICFGGLNRLKYCYSISRRNILVKLRNKGVVGQVSLTTTVIPAESRWVKCPKEHPKVTLSHLSGQERRSLCSSVLYMTSFRPAK